MIKTIAAGIAAIAAALVLVLGGGTAMAALANCPTTIDPARAAGQTIAGKTGDRLANAATIINTVAASKVDDRAAGIAVMAAIALSNLGNIDDGTDRAGIYRQGTADGTKQDRLDPAKATAVFVGKLTAIPTWTTAAPGELAAAVDSSIDAATYQASYAGAAEIVQTLRTQSSTCAVSGDQQALATELMQAYAIGKFRGLVPAHIQEIRWIADGKTVPECGIDTQILQLIVAAVRHFDSVTVSTINRRCTGQIIGAGINSAHYKNGGGHAVDFAALNGQPLTGADPNSIALITYLDPLASQGSHVGQIQCRAALGIHLALATFGQFDDTCDHLHVDVPR